MTQRSHVDSRFFGHAWLISQLEAWPSRVDAEKTLNIGYLMKAAAEALKGYAQPIDESPPKSIPTVPIPDQGATADDAVERMRNALTRYTAAVKALGARSTVEPSRILFDERPMSTEGTAAWLELNEAGKQAAAALATDAVERGEGA